jgi:hypothetical protein
MAFGLLETQMPQPTYGSSIFDAAQGTPVNNPYLQGYNTDYAAREAAFSRDPGQYTQFRWEDTTPAPVPTTGLQGGLLANNDVYGQREGGGDSPGRQQGPQYSNPSGSDPFNPDSWQGAKSFPPGVVGSYVDGTYQAGSLPTSMQGFVDSMNSFSPQTAVKDLLSGYNDMDLTTSAADLGKSITDTMADPGKAISEGMGWGDDGYHGDKALGDEGKVSGPIADVLSPIGTFVASAAAPFGLAARGFQMAGLNRALNAAATNNKVTPQTLGLFDFLSAAMPFGLGTSLKDAARQNIGKMATAAWGGRTPNSAPNAQAQATIDAANKAAAATSGYGWGDGQNSGYGGDGNSQGGGMGSGDTDSSPGGKGGV